MNFIIASIPSPSNGVWSLGPFPLRAYALIILLGIGVAIYLGNKRWIERGGLKDQVLDVAMWAVPFGVIGGRLYHVLTDWSTYFSENGRGFLAALKIWEGGLGIWGAIALGGVGVYIAAKRMQLAFLPLADALAPGIVLAQAIGRFGNYFNQELFGRPTTLPWGLEIDAIHRPVGYEEFATFHPTFLYESIACVAIAAIIIWADKKFTLGYGRVFALYVALYCAARGVIETVRIDEATRLLGIRLNVFTALIIGLGALTYFVLSAERYPGREVVENGQVLSKRAIRERAAQLQATQLQATQEQVQTSSDSSGVSASETVTSVEVLAGETKVEVEQMSAEQTSTEQTSTEQMSTDFDLNTPSEDSGTESVQSAEEQSAEQQSVEQHVTKERGRRRKR